MYLQAHVRVEVLFHLATVDQVCFVKSIDMSFHFRFHASVPSPYKDELCQTCGHIGTNNLVDDRKNASDWVQVDQINTSLVVRSSRQLTIARCRCIRKGLLLRYPNWKINSKHKRNRHSVEEMPLEPARQQLTGTLLPAKMFGHAQQCNVLLLPCMLPLLPQEE